MSLYLGDQPIAGINTPVQGRVLGQIIQSTIPLNDAGLHLADGSLINGNGIYKNFYDYMMSGYENGIRINGSLTNNNGVFSGFNNDSYLYIPGVRTNDNTEFVIKFTTGSDITTSQCVISCEHFLALDVASGKLSSWNWEAASAVQFSWSLFTNQTYYVKIICNGNTRTFNISVNGNSYSELGSFTDSTITNNIDELYQFVLGRYSHQASNPFLGSIDVKGCYIKRNNELLWDGSQYSVLPGRYIDETRYQKYMTDYGVCGKYAISYKDKTIRLPYITGIIEGTLNSNHIGNVTAAGLPNITGKADNFRSSNGADTSFSGALTYTYTTEWPSNNSKVTDRTYYGGIKFDASRSSSIYGNSDTVQPQTVKVYYYIVIATLTKTDIEVDIDEIATDLNDKVDKSDLVETAAIIIETYIKGSSWYNLYSNGWIEQGGKYTYSSAGQKTISLLKSIDITRPVYFSYKLVTTRSAGAYERECNVNSYTSSNFVVYTSTSNGSEAFWEAKGYIL